MSDTPETLIQKLNEAIARDDHGEIIKISTQIIDHPDANDDIKAFAYCCRGIRYSGEGKYDPAIQDFDKAIELKPSYAKAYNNRGNAYSNKGDHDRAIQDYNKVIELDPNYAGAYSNRGNAYDNKGDHDRAIQDYDKAIKLDSDDADAYYNRGKAYDGKGDYDRALQDYDKAIELKPNYLEAYGSRGNAYSGKGEHDRAIQDYNKVIELDPNDTKAYNNRGNAYNNKGDHDRAIQDYGKAIELNPNDAEAYNNRGIAFLRKSEYDSAFQDFEKTLRIDPNHKNAIHGRGIAIALKHAEEDRKKFSSEYEKELEKEKELSKKQQEEFKQKLESHLGKIVDYYKDKEQYHKIELGGDGGKNKGLEKKLSRGILWLFLSAIATYSAVIALYIYIFIGIPESIPKNFSPYGVLPFILVGTLILAPLFLNVRNLKQKVKEHSVLREDASTNYILGTHMNSSQFNASKEVYEELLKKFFDHHDKRGIAQLIASLDRPIKKGDNDNIVQAIMDQTKKE